MKPIPTRLPFSEFKKDFEKLYKKYREHHFDSGEILNLALGVLTAEIETESAERAGTYLKWRVREYQNLVSTYQYYAMSTLWALNRDTEQRLADLEEKFKEK